MRLDILRRVGLALLKHGSWQRLGELVHMDAFRSLQCGAGVLRPDEGTAEAADNLLSKEAGVWAVALGDRLALV